MANCAYTRGVKLCFKNGIFVPLSKRHFFNIHFEMSTVLSRTVDATCKYNDEMIKETKQHGNCVRRTRICWNTFVRRNR